MRSLIGSNSPEYLAVVGGLVTHSHGRITHPHSSLFKNLPLSSSFNLFSHLSLSVFPFSPFLSLSCFFLLAFLLASKDFQFPNFLGFFYEVLKLNQRCLFCSWVFSQIFVFEELLLNLKFCFVGFNLFVCRYSSNSIICKLGK